MLKYFLGGATAVDEKPELIKKVNREKNAWVFSFVVHLRMGLNLAEYLFIIILNN